MVAGKLYRHKKAIDVSFLVVIVFSEDNDSLTLLGKWFHNKYKYFLAKDDIVVQKKDLSNWREIYE